MTRMKRNAVTVAMTVGAAMGLSACDDKSESTTTAPVVSVSPGVSATPSDTVTPDVSATLPETVTPDASRHDHQLDEDLDAEVEISMIGTAIYRWFVNNDTIPTVIKNSDGYYVVGGSLLDYQSSPNVVIGGVTGSSYDECCVWVTNSEGDVAVKGYQFSTQGGVEAGNCK
jgi:hypothetical protein